MRLTALTVTVALLTAACAENPTRRTALLLADEIETYRDAINKKLAAERKFYKYTNKTLVESAERALRLESEIYAISRVDQLVDQMLIDDKGVHLTRLRAFLREINAERQKAARERVDRAADAKSRAALSFAKLSIKQKEIDKAKNSVMELARKEKIKDRVKKLFDLAKEAKKKADELDKADQ